MDNVTLQDTRWDFLEDENVMANVNQQHVIITDFLLQNKKDNWCHKVYFYIDIDCVSIVFISKNKTCSEESELSGPFTNIIHFRIYMCPMPIIAR